MAWRVMFLLILVIAVITGCSRPPSSGPQQSAEKAAMNIPDREDNLAPLDWGIILYGLRASDEDASLSISPEQAKKFIPLVNELLANSRSSAGLKRAINGTLAQDQVEYLLKLAAQDGLDKDEFIEELRKFPPETALLDLVDSRLKQLSEKASPEPKEPEIFPQRKKEIHVVSDLLVGILKIEDLTADQAYLIRGYLSRVRPLLAREAGISREMEESLTTSQREFILKNRERFTLMTDELPVEPVQGEEAWLSQAETPFLKSMKDFFKSRMK